MPDTVPYAPSLRLGDQAFQSSARVRMGVRTLSSSGNAWTCACGHTVEDSDVAHALGYSLLSGVAQRRHDDTAELLRRLPGLFF
jgi:hypothetical protein